MKDNNLSGSINLNNSVKKIGVNDKGDYITIPMNDTGFINRFFVALENIQKTAATFKNYDNENVREYLSSMEEKTREITSYIDALFGAGTTLKVFGCEVPMIDLIYDFFEQLLPFIEEFANERQKKITSKYNANRRGSNV